MSSNSRAIKFTGIVLLIILLLILGIFVEEKNEVKKNNNEVEDVFQSENEATDNAEYFKIIASSENLAIERILTNFAKKNNINLLIVSYALDYFSLLKFLHEL